MLNQQGLFEDDEQELCAGTGLFSCLPQNISTNIQQPIFHLNSLKTLTSSVTSPSNYPLTLLPQQNTPGIFFSFAANQKDTGDMPSHIHRSTTTNPWEWGEMNDCKQISNRAGEDLDDCNGVGDGVHRHNNHHRIGISALKMKKMKPMSSGGRRKVREPRFCFKTMSDVDVLDDGYKWRKYGQKVVKNTHHPRSYYRCTQDNCRVKKRVERLAEDPRMVITTYEGRHVHSPSHDEDDSQSPSRLNNFFW